ncbi:MAG TPA: glyceraldehyde 3-phosphate dehydrogenase NAD-binding domain-containing protein [Acidimicrobiia bacterium]|jgi:glyceraldehyde 3-phosphate dehydrogenase|nr:glyceraldehyde 3-phosphate dehydrogenase NAD-binding domain-containing protein [Acidimicrobiia bacterium]
MSKTRIGLMGFGRIGRNVFRLVRSHPDLEIGVVCDVADPAGLTYLLKYDSIYGRYPGEVHFADGVLTADQREVAFIQKKTPAEVPWADYGVDLVIEATTRYRTRAANEDHLANGARAVVVASSPETPGEIPMVLMGINDEVLDKGPDIVALGSNTSNAVAPVLRTLDEEFGIERAFWTTVHAMSNSGRLADVPGEGFRSSRAAGENIIPEETNSPDIITEVMPEFAGKLSAVALNVPVPDGSTVDLVAEVGRSTKVDEVNEAIREAAASRYRNILEYVADPIVSSDVKGSTYSGLFDSLSTMVMEGTMVKTITWFNNGWGYSARLVEVVERLSQQIVKEPTA